MLTLVPVALRVAAGLTVIRAHWEGCPHAPTPPRARPGKRLQAGGGALLGPHLVESTATPQPKSTCAGGQDVTRFRRDPSRPRAPTPTPPTPRRRRHLAPSVNSQLQGFSPTFGGGRAASGPDAADVHCAKTRGGAGAFCHSTRCGAARPNVLLDCSLSYVCDARGGRSGIEPDSHLGHGVA